VTRGRFYAQFMLYALQVDVRILYAEISLIE